MIKINPATIRLLARSDSARIAFEAIGVAIAEGVKHNAKDRHYADSVETRWNVDQLRVGTDYPFAHLDEWGSVNNPPTAAMRRSIESLGLNLKMSPKR